MIQKLHIGKIISEILSQKEVSHQDIARRLDIPESIFALMLKNDDVGCNILFRISKILDHDFFHHYSKQLKFPDSSVNGFDNLEKKFVGGES